MRAAGTSPQMKEPGMPRLSRIGTAAYLRQLDDLTDERGAARHVARTALVLRLARELDALVVAADVHDGVPADALGVLGKRDHRREKCPVAGFLVRLVEEVG